MLDVRRAVGADGRTIVQATGQVDLATAGQLSKCLAEVTQDGVKDILVDLSGVDFMDSTGVRVLVQAARDAARAKARLHVQGAQGWVARVLEITGVDEFLRVPGQETPVSEAPR